MSKSIVQLALGDSRVALLLAMSHTPSTIWSGLMQNEWNWRWHLKSLLFWLAYILHCKEDMGQIDTSHLKVCGCYLVTFLNQPSIFD